MLCSWTPKTQCFTSLNGRKLQACVERRSSELKLRVERRTRKGGELSAIFKTSTTHYAAAWSRLTETFSRRLRGSFAFSVYLTYAGRGHLLLKFSLFRSLFLLLFSCSALSTSIIAAMEGFCVGPIMEKIINTFTDDLNDSLKDYIKDQIRWQTDMEEELERLRVNHPKIQAVVDFAVNKAQISDQNYPALKKWIWQLREAIDEANDVLDELEYMKHKEQLSKNTEETKKGKFTSFTSFLFDIPGKIFKMGERVLKGDPYLKRLKEAVQKLDKVSANFTTFFPLVQSAKHEQEKQEVDLDKIRQSGASPTSDLIGRGEAKNFVMQWLRKPSNEPRTTDLYRNISLLSIVGHGGMGKTTLLQHVYEDVMTEEFGLKIWVCISNNFDVNKIIADILESLKKERPRLETYEALRDCLRTEMKPKKFLLVLDDIWESDDKYDKEKWEKLLAPLANGEIGSRILVTTRMDSVAMKIARVIGEKTEIFRLEGLKEDECLQLFGSHAFDGHVEMPANDRKKLEDIAKERVKKLSGSPLAAKVIGCLLNSSLDETHWTKVLNSDFVSPTSAQNGIFLILRLSYMFLPKHLQNCFAFCSIFQQDFRFFKDDLVRMWIALGFIQQPHNLEWTMEDIGGRYVDALVKKSFFDKFEDEYFGVYYKMHDLIHELAKSISIDECLRVEDGTKSPSIIPNTLRHLFVETTNPDIINKIGQFKHLHSLFLFYEASNQDLCNALLEIFKASRSLRLLYISSISLKKIPEGIENLIHLRYLKIDDRDLTMLPRSLINLYHLQYIIYGSQGMPSQEIPNQHQAYAFLPSDINNLSKLRYVKLPDHYCISSIRGIGKLKSLQEVDMFYLRNEMGYRIDEFKYMNNLCKLGINCLENVKDADEARNAQLCEKRSLTDLTLCWSWSNTDSRNISLNENVLDKLQPPEYLRNLRIKRYMGARSAKWMNDVNPIFNLVKIELKYCLECETLPPFGRLPFLKSLKLYKMPKVKTLESKFKENDTYRAFPALEVLCIDELDALEDWFEEGVAAENVAAEDGCLFSCLIYLRLRDSPKLKEFPSLPPKLRRLEINQIGWETLNFCSGSNSIPLERLKVFDCPNITSLPLADEIARLAALRYLTILNCPNLISLGRYREGETTNNFHLMLSNLWISNPSVLLMEPLNSIASLEKLAIWGNDKVVSFPNGAEQWFLKVRSSLSYLGFSSLESLQSLPSFLQSLDSLQELSIYKVPTLRELPNLPPSLKRLQISGCPELHDRYRYGGGPDWNKIAHISHVLIFHL